MRAIRRPANLGRDAWRVLALLMTITGAKPLTADGMASVREPATTIPVLHEVDMVVVGGSSGAVEAAVAAAEAGAKVFLAAPRPYLGEDICASRRLWLEPGEQPLTALAHQVFEAPAATPRSASLEGGYAFTYTADRPPALRHRDTRPPSRLSDGQWHSAASHSVEFSEAVTFTLDLGQPREVRRVVLLAYQQPGDYVVGRFTVAGSDNGSDWKPLGSRANDLFDIGPRHENPLRLTAAVSARCRYLQVRVLPAAEARRMLLGEMVVLGTDPEPDSRPEGRQPLTPMQVKLALDRALIRANVPFLYPSVATGLLRDDRGRPAGIVMDNRSGRQSVVAKIILDATERGTVARMAEARFTPYPAGTQVFRRVVINGPPREGGPVSLVKREQPVTLVDRKGDLHIFHEYELRLPVGSADFATFAQAEQLARDLTWTRESNDGSETLFQVPPDWMQSRKSHPGAWPGAGQLPLECLQAAGAENVYLLGGCADVSRAAAAQLVRPVNLMALGARLGGVLAQQAAAMSTPKGVSVVTQKAAVLVPGEVRQPNWLNPGRTVPGAVPAGDGAVPVWGEYDVVVVGGGTGGAPAAIAAGRQGARTLLVEFLHELGGVGTAGLIAKYYYGNRVGFTAEVDQGVIALEGGEDSRTSGGGWRPETKSEWYRRQLRQAGVDVWFGALGQGAVVEQERVTGVVVVTPLGRGVVRAKVVVDATGNADIAAAAGAVCRYTDDTEVAVQGTGLPPRELDARYVNTDYLFVDDTDMVDIWRAFVTAREKYQRNYDLAQLVDTRERRQIVGELVLSPLDYLLGRTFPDTVVISRSNFDSHGYTVHPLFLLRQPDRGVLAAHVPYRCLLPQGRDGILVTGLGISAHRDTLPIIRMQADIQNQGYAAGVAAAWIARDGIPTRKLDIKRLQRHLVEIGNLPSTVLTNQDSFPLPRERFEAAAVRVIHDYSDLEVLLTDPPLSRPLLRDHLARASNAAEQLVYAHILGMLGDKAGAPVLREAVQSAPWDEGWDFRGGGQYELSLSRLDSYIIALGRTRDPAALPALVEKANTLSANSSFSHFRAIALGLESLGEPDAAPALARLLQLPGVGGHATTNIQSALQRRQTRVNEDQVRGRELAELSLARALYRCGDCDGLGELTLRQYAHSLSGHYARHAQAVLAGRRVPRAP